MLEMQLARTALNDRIEHLNRLILSSKSSGVNNSGKMSSLSTHQTHSMSHKSESSARTLRSLRSSASQSTLGGPAASQARTVSIGSTVTIPGLGDNTQQSPNSSHDNDEDSGGEYGDGNATSKSRIRALQADLADKNRYISTLEQRLLHARRSSQSRASLLGQQPNSPRTTNSLEVDSKTVDLLGDKDAEIAELRAQLDDKNRMVNALQSAARHREIADLASEPGTPLERRRESLHQSKDSKDSKTSKDSAGSSNSNHGFSSTVSPVQLLSPHKEKEKEKAMKRKSIDEMTKILDGMIQDRVQTGGLVIGANGVVRPVHERRKESLGAVPSVGALAAQLRPTSTISEGGGI